MKEIKKWRCNKCGCNFAIEEITIDMQEETIKSVKLCCGCLGVEGITKVGATNFDKFFLWSELMDICWELIKNFFKKSTDLE